jgi:pimeloyl-ACP methyl ester carboxylesterase
MQTKPSIVFVHGIWADGSRFSKVIPTLQAEGHEVIAAQYGLDTLAGDVAAVKRTLRRVSSPAILVGHSYGGTVITAVGADDRVEGLVYIAALAPDAGETSQSQLDQFPTTDIFSHIEIADGRVWMLPQGVTCFAEDRSDQEQKLVWAAHFAPAADLFNQKVDGTAWRSKPSWYIVANNDRTVQPELQRFVAKRMGASIYEVVTSHVPMLSQPGFAIDVIRTAPTPFQAPRPGRPDDSRTEPCNGCSLACEFTRNKQSSPHRESHPEHHRRDRGGPPRNGCSRARAAHQNRGPGGVTSNEARRT